MEGPYAFLSLAYHYAVVGASRDSSKYGYTVFTNLRRGGFNVVPVNPRAKEIDGISAAASIGDVTPKPDVVVVAVPPGIAAEVLEQAVQLQIQKIWFEPGTESDAIIRRAQELGIDFSVRECIMVQRRRLSIGQ